MRTKEETIEYFTKFIEDYKKDPKTPEKIRARHRKYGKLTRDDLATTFTI
ncbi:MAG: hypothetical protein ACOWW1_01080 [archaeon]|nr:hypothetical protein [Candidatus Bathyarchaeum sp.]